MDLVALFKAYPALWLGLVALGALLLWVAYSILAVRGIEEPEYAVVEKRANYEVRRYTSHIVAETVVDGSYRGAMNEGFRRLAGYIFGGNTRAERVSMTAPVGESGEKISMTAPVSERESIAMTVPVGEQGAQNARRISFVMPSAYTMETLPVPNDARVILRVVPERLVAAQRFTASMNDAEVTELKRAFLAVLQAEGYTVLEEPQAAYYNPPWTPPFLRRNELLVPVRR